MPVGGIRGLGLTARELKLVKEQIEPGSRRFLLKQGIHSVVCELDLAGFDVSWRSFPGGGPDFTRMQQIIAARGVDPASRLPAFMARE